MSTIKSGLFPLVLVANVQAKGELFLIVFVALAELKSKSPLVRERRVLKVDVAVVLVAVR